MEGEEEEDGEEARAFGTPVSNFASSWGFLWFVLGVSRMTIGCHGCPMLFGFRRGLVNPSVLRLCLLDRQ